MIFYEPIAVGLTQLRANKLRSFLTLLGIVIGVGSVIGIVSLGEGLRLTIQENLAQQGGATSIQIQPPRSWERKGGRWVERPWREYLYSADLGAITGQAEDIETALPSVQGSVQLQYGKTTLQSSYTGTTQDYGQGFNWAVQLGRHLSDDDIRLARRVCVVGDKILTDLFDGANPTGAEIKLDGQRYTVIGVLEERVRFGQNQGNVVLIPYTTAQKRHTGDQRLGAITLFAREIDAVEKVVAIARRVLKQRHEHGDEFRIESSQGEMDEVNQVTGIMKMVAGGIAGISLLVGGIGIMNIMLVSVTERTREIGIRKALGAKSHQILFQFLAEAIVLSLCGGLLGTAVGAGFGGLMALVIHHFDPNSPFVSVIDPQTVFWAMAFAGLVGVFSGVYPAGRAARMDPVEALRYE
ncbi:MAG: FtsX-like permease family protein [Candidatus Latescibacteria bacterium]|nr:FtsX-like permease family protein [Candidatus Latescibacterota bacterium]